MIQGEMPTHLYLDSARMGLLSERARLAHFDYVRLASTEGCSLYFSQLVEDGYQNWPMKVKQQYPNLEDWQGAVEFEQILKRLVNAPAGVEVLLANRTSQLMKLTIHELCCRCNRVLVSDLTWPSYRRMFEALRKRNRVGVSTVSVRRMLELGTSSDDIVDRFVGDYEAMGCDGLFLPVISHDGLRLPVDEICQRINEVRHPKFLALDGAQALGHVPDQLGLTYCDVFVSGTHKWLQGHLPMGVAYLPRSDSQKRLLRACEHLYQTCQLDDPLLSFTQQMKVGGLCRFSETVNLASLFTSRAALAEHCGRARNISRRLDIMLHNAMRVSKLAPQLGWSVLPTLLPNGITMLQSRRADVRCMAPEKLRDFFARLGVSVSTYENGLIRLAMPPHHLRCGDLDLLAWSLEWCNKQETTRLAAGSSVSLEPRCRQNSGSRATTDSTAPLIP